MGPTERIKILSQQLRPEPQAVSSDPWALWREYVESADKLLKDGTPPSITQFDLGQLTQNGLGADGQELVKMLDQCSPEVLSLVELLPGPWNEHRDKKDRLKFLKKVQYAEAQGYNVQLIAAWQLRYGGSLGSNIVVPVVQGHFFGRKVEGQIRARVIVGDPEDAERLSRIHVRKEPNFEVALADSIISTSDNDLWRQQRQHFAEAFMPLSSLAEILPTSLARAKGCVERLREAAQAGPVDMSDFLLHEAQAQLQLALLAVQPQLVEETNAPIRSVFQGDPGANEPRALAVALQRILEAVKADPSLALPTEGAVRGPVSRALQTAEIPASAVWGNMLLLLFAGHDTTGHTMTWMLFELARRPQLQAQLQQEVDGFFERLGPRDLTFRDLSGLDLMDRCITETLRLWPAVANGTFRQLQFADTVSGPAGPVTLPKGTLVHIVNWSRHRNPSLWGSDVDDFNPHREFTAQELSRVGCPMSAKNPQSARFSPFAHAPRSCLGRNFAQMEIRIIMLQLFRHFDFSLAPPYDALPLGQSGPAPGPNEFRGVNRATMGPLDLESVGQRHRYAVKMLVTQRRASSDWHCGLGTA